MNESDKTKAIDSKKINLPKLEELKKLRVPVRNAYEEHRKKLTPLEQMAIFIADRVGSAGFFVIIVAWTVIWLLWNTFAPNELKFDPFPAFVLWLFISNMIQLFLLPMILISENVQNRVDKEQAIADYEVNRKAEQETEAILQHLEYQNEILTQILNKIDNK